MYMYVMEIDVHVHVQYVMEIHAHVELIIKKETTVSKA